MRNLKKYLEFLNESAFAIPAKEYDKAAELLASICQKYKGVREMPEGSKKGPEISEWLKNAGAKPGQNWCMAFIYAIFGELAANLGLDNPLPKTASVMDHWAKTDTAYKVNVSDVNQDTEKLKPGMIFVIHRPKGGDEKNLGHCGIIISVDPIKKTFVSIEGNANDLGSGESGRVGINQRKMADPLIIGYTDYFSPLRKEGFDGALETHIKTLLSDDIERIRFKNPISN